MAKQCQNKIRSHIQTILSDLTLRDYDVLYIGVFGSWNYELADEQSDYDFKAIISLKPDQIEMNINDVVIKYDFGECILLTLHHFAKESNEFNLAVLEVIFSSYNYVDVNRFPLEQIRRIITNMLVNNRKAFASEIMRIMCKIEKTFLSFAYVGKKASNIIRLYYLFESFNRTKSYSESLVIPCTMKQTIMDIKRGITSRVVTTELCNDHIKKFEHYTDVKYVESIILKRHLTVFINGLYQNILFEKLLQRKRQADSELQIVLSSEYEMIGGACGACGGSIDVGTSVEPSSLSSSLSDVEEEDHTTSHDDNMNTHHMKSNTGDASLRCSAVFGLVVTFIISLFVLAP
jgi:hypothetical protein